jgi:4-amino-4-deoxy-L-arabinose transferase-like glycosyltransferase
MAAAPPRSENGTVARVLSALARPPVRSALVLAFALALFLGVPWKDRSLTGDAIVYAETGREIVQRGDPTRLTLDGRFAPNKPPLVFWMLAATFSLLPANDFSASLPSQAAGLATILLLMALVGRHHGRRAAFWAALACATWATFQRSAHTCRLETTLAFFNLAALGAYLHLDRRGFTVPRALALGALLGLGILAKGPPGLVPAGAIVVASAVTGRGRLLARCAPWALLATAAVALPWYAMQVLREGPEWWRRLHADWTRTSAPVQGLLPALGFYLTDVFLPSLAWLPPLVGGARLALRRIVRRRSQALAEALMLAWIACLLAALPALRMHYSRYFAQVVPAFAWLGGMWLAPAARRLTQRVKVLRRAPPHAVTAALLAATVLVGYPVYLALRLDGRQDRYEDLEVAVRTLRAEDPGASVLPAWSRGLERGERLSAPLLAASRFYFDTPLVPFRADDRSLPPVVLFWQGSAGPDDAEAFGTANGFRVLARTGRGTVFRTRDPGR